MEKQDASLHSKLKANTYKEFVISYYSNFFGFKTERLRLIDIYKFSYLTVSNNREFFEIDFFGSTMIESITMVGDNEPIYFNPYVREYVSTTTTIDERTRDKIKNNFINSIDMERIITKKELFLINYFEKKSIKFEDLFFSDKQKEEFTSLLNLLINELVDYAKKKGLDSNIVPIVGGSTSIVYSIGDKILKFGRPRQTISIPYCEFLLQPIVNRIVVFDDIPIQIEVTQKVLTYKDLDDKNKRKLEQEIPKLQRKLHSIGLSCKDLHKGNIGILTADNIIDFDGIYHQTGNEEATSIANNNNLVVRKKGDIVIIDLDYLEIINPKKYQRYLTKIGYIPQQDDVITHKSKR